MLFAARVWLIVAVFASAQALMASAACAAPRESTDRQVLETFIKLTDAGLAQRGGQDRLDRAQSRDRLLDALERVGVPVGVEVRESDAEGPSELALVILSQISKSERKILIDKLRKYRGPPPSRGPTGQRPGDDDVETYNDDTQHSEPVTPASAPASGADTPKPDPGSGVSSTDPPSGAGSTALSYTLGPRDGIEIVFLDRQIAPSGKENETLQVTINLEGKVVLPLLGVVHAGGQTVDQFRTRLVELYRKYIQSPRLTIFVIQYNSKKVYLVGEFVKEGAISLSGETETLFDIVAKGGGLKAEADKEHLIVIRGQRKVVVNFQEELLRPGISSQFIVQPGDRIIAPKPMFKISILGGVNKAGDVTYESGMTLLKAIAQAGSFNDGARRDRIKIIRKTLTKREESDKGPGKTLTLNVDATAIFRGKADDLALRPGDTVYVSEW